MAMMYLMLTEERSGSSSRRPTMKAAVLVLASTFISLLLCEAGLRLFTRYGRNASPPPMPATTQDKPLDTAGAMRCVTQLAAAPGSDRGWFAEDPPRLANRLPVRSQDLERFRDY